MNLISINGMRIEMRGKRLFVNGKEWGPLGERVLVTAQEDAGPVSIDLPKGERTFNQDISGDLHIMGGPNVKVILNGVVEGDVTVDHGSVECTSVGGSVQAGANVGCRSVGGSVNAGGNVDCRSVGGSVNAGGTISGVKPSQGRGGSINISGGGVSVRGSVRGTTIVIGDDDDR